jgi:hypothetical protein
MRPPVSAVRPFHLCLLLLVAAALSGPAAAQTVVRHLEVEASLVERQVERLMTRYRSARAREEAAQGRADELAGEIDRRLEAGGAPAADLESLSSELSEAAARAGSAAAEARLVRHDLLEALRRGETIAAELRRLRGAPADLPDPLTGTWELTLEPRAQSAAQSGTRRGLLDLTLDGTTVRGTLGLDDGSFGSVTGNFTGGALRLERVSAESGLDMVLEGRLAADGSLRGTWRPLILGRGEPPGGTWQARLSDAGTDDVTGEGDGGAR